MHYAAVVVVLVIVVHCVLVVLVEVVFRALCDVLLDNANVIIAIPRTLLMVEAQGVQKLMHNGAQTEAARVQIIILQIQLLHTVSVADIRETAAGLRGDIDIVRLIAGGFLEDETGIRLEQTYAANNVITMLLI